MNLYERFQRRVRAQPNAPAVKSPDGSDRSYGTLDDQARRVAAWFDEVETEVDRIAVYMADTPSYLPVVFGAWRAGYTVVPLNTRLSRAELEFILEDVNPAAIFTDDTFANEANGLADVVDSVEHVVTARTTRGFDTDPFPSPDRAPKTVTRLDSDRAIIMHTSGTTGEPKGVVQTHRNIGAQVDSGIRLFNFTAEDTSLAAAPLFHVGGFHGAVLMLLFAGGSVAIQADWDPAEWARIIDEAEVTYSGLVPTMMVDVLESSVTRSHDTSSLRLCSFGGSPAPETLLREFEDTFDVSLVNYYGQTENAGVSVTSDVNDERKPGAMGKPTPAVKAKIVDIDTGERVAQGEKGELLLKGDIITPGYWNRPQSNAELFTDGWLHTEDVVRKDEDGYLYYVDRLDDIIHSGGEKIPPARVEDALQKMDEITSVAVIGTPHDRYGEVVTAVVISDGELTERQVQSFCDERDDLADYMKPRRVVFVDDFPRTGSHKIDKQELADSVLDSLDQ